MAEAGPSTYPVSTIAKLFGLTERRVQQLVDEGVIKRVSPGKYDLVGSVQGYIRYLKLQATGQKGEPGTPNYHDEKARKIKFEADIAEMEAGKMKGELVDAEEMRDALDLVITEIKAKLLNNAPTRIAARAKSERKVAALKNIAKEEIAAALLALSKTDPADLVASD